MFRLKRTILQDTKVELVSSPDNEEDVDHAQIRVQIGKRSYHSTEVDPAHTSKPFNATSAFGKAVAARIGETYIQNDGSHLNVPTVHEWLKAAYKAQVKSEDYDHELETSCGTAERWEGDWLTIKHPSPEAFFISLSLGVRTDDNLL